MVDVPPEVQARRDRQREEYGQFVAVQRIYHNGVLAYTPGRPVPASNVHAHGYDKMGLVKRVGGTTATTKAKEGSGDAK